MTNAMSSGAANAGIRYRGPGTSLSGSAYWMTIAARTARVAGQRGSPPLGRADHGRCGWVLPSGGRGGGVLGMGLLRSPAPPAAVDGRGAATGSSGQCPAPAGRTRGFRVLGCSIRLPAGARVLGGGARPRRGTGGGCGSRGARARDHSIGPHRRPEGAGLGVVPETGGPDAVDGAVSYTHLTLPTIY